MNPIINQLNNLYEKWASEESLNVIPIAPSGSYRKYFRISGKGTTAIGVFNPDKKENTAFISFTKHFLKKTLSVPELYAQQLKENIYLIEDLGDTTLYSFIEENYTQGTFSNKLLKYYKDALTHLIKFQIDGNKGLDYSVSYPRAKFDKQSIMWDLNYFKYYFLKLVKIPFNEQKLENDFENFARLLLSADTKYFMYRDFQTRNILIHDNQLYFIDYQGGRKGALQYDVASLLFQAKANLPASTREELLEYYINELSKKSIPTYRDKSKNFNSHYYNYVLIRLLQTLGAYGFRGYYENKSHFLLSIPFAVKNLEWLIENDHIPKKLPELKSSLISILTNDEIQKLTSVLPDEKLKVTINSFSYKDGIPKDFSGNGGGFVFDCRSLDNPGRYPEYVNSTGLDENVINFLQEKNDVKDFLNSIFSIVGKSINNYLERDFKNLMINFGCTGGQHRSVYCAEKLVSHLKDKYNISVLVNHIQLNKKVIF